mmetsp:Transcript_38314/g.92409  ORF Transcript_38314/g.92409 Transcript_38314/m.92409 type:complete len:472 (-) Transcript_38314:7-1422(-)
MMCRLTPSERSHLLGNDDRTCSDRPSSACWQSLSSQNKTIPNEQNGTNTKRHTWLVILFGQTITLALSCANAASSALENNYQIKVPTFQTGMVYFVLSFHLLHLLWRHWKKQNVAIEDIPCYRHQQSSAMQQLSIEKSDLLSSNTTIKIQQYHKFPFTTLPLHTSWYTYLLLTILDVEANYLAMLSFQHTSLSSSMLLTSLSVLSTVLLRQLIFRKANYDRKQLFGVFMCLVGGCLWLRADFYPNREGGVEGIHLGSNNLGTLQPTRESHSDIVFGDLLALSAACLYGLNDVLAEYFVKANNDRVEYLGMLGLFGTIFSFFVQVPMLEREEIKELFTDFNRIHDSGSSSGAFFNSVMGATVLVVCFIIMLCYFYISVMAFLSAYDATILNLSLQTGPLWAVVLTKLQTLMKGDNNGRLLMPPPVFFVSLTMVMAGMFLYESHSGNENDNWEVNETDHSNDTNAKLDRGTIT